MVSVGEKTMDACARNVVNSLNVSRGEAVIVKGGAHSMRMLEKIAVECYRQGAVPLITVSSDRYMKEVFRTASPSVLSITPRHLEGAVRSADAIIVLEEFDNPGLMASLPRNKIHARQKSVMPIVDIIHKPTEGKKWAYVGWPTEAAAKAYGVSFSDLRRLVLGGISVPPAQLMRTGRRLQGKFADASWVHIWDDKGTDFRVRIDGRRANIDDGFISDDDIEANDRGANLPAGELFYATHETVGEGTFYCPVTRDQTTEKLVRDVRFTFRDGKLDLQSISARINADLIVKSFKAAQRIDSRRYKPVRTTNIAELGIGFNPRIDRAIGYILTDEKICGTAHIAFGMNKSYGGTSASAIHWDFVTAPGVNIDAERRDGSVAKVMRKGEML
ncbi:MAG: aminopeptidase [Thermoplasmata archaeon]